MTKAIVKKPIKIPTVIPALHNVILTLWSLIMFVGTAYAAIQDSVKH